MGFIPSPVPKGERPGAPGASWLWAFRQKKGARYVHRVPPGRDFCLGCFPRVSPGAIFLQSLRDGRLRWTGPDRCSIEAEQMFNRCAGMLTNARLSRLFECGHL
jgi:hypothetical protein